jgi:integrase
VILVVAGWDDEEGEIEVKSRSGLRAVPIIAELRPILLAHLMATGRRGKPEALVFGRTDADPFLRSTPRSRARRAWKSAGLEPITMHECRHSYASTMVAAGVDPGEVMRRMGHSTIAMTLDRYTHALAGNEADTAAKMQSFIDRSRGTVPGQSSIAASGPERC